MDTQVRISIVTITFNAQRSLPRTLDSVARQSYGHIEHLIVDGDSKDDTVSIAERYKAAVPYPVVITSEPDKGLYDAMNKGLQRATGDYVLFLNAGDTLHSPDTLQTVIDKTENGEWRAENGELRTERYDYFQGGHVTEKSNHTSQFSTLNSQLKEKLPAVIYGDTAITDGEGRFLRLRRLRPPKQLSWRSFKQGMLVCHQAFYARTDIARECPYDLQYRHSADVDWCIRVMKEAEHRRLPLVNTHAVLADFEEGGDTTQHHRDSLKERFNVMRRHYGIVTTLVMHAWFVVRAVIRK